MLASASNSEFVGYDVIGDVHGCATLLEKLLCGLGYQYIDGAYRYADKTQPRQIVFVGDLVDRGTEIRQTLAIVKAMLAVGSAQMDMIM